MKIEEVKTGILVVISNPIENKIDGVERKKGAIGMVDSPVFGGGGVWWWIVHRDGTQVKYRYCEISEIKTIKVVEAEGKDIEISEGNEIEADPFIYD